jgi:Predicted membrane protein
MQAAASIGLLLMSVNTQLGLAQQTNPTAPATPQAVVNDTTGQPGLPQAPQPKLTEPLYLRDTNHNYAQPKSHFWNPIAPYTATDVPQTRLDNTPYLNSLMRDGKIYLSLSDAVTLALENNYDIAIARINLDIADTDILRAKAGSSLRGISTGVVTNTIGGSGTTVASGGGPGGTSSGAGGGGTGASGLVLSTNGGGPAPEFRDPVLTGQLGYEDLKQQQSEHPVQRWSSPVDHGHRYVQLWLPAGFRYRNRIERDVQ